MHDDLATACAAAIAPSATRRPRPTRLLLVDDEQNVLEGLRRLLRPLREGWEVRTATSGLEAIALLDAQPADVVISDMRMPGMDGATLLAIVRQRSPATLRIVLSGQTDQATALRVIPLAHQFLSKPCEPGELIEVLSRLRHALASLDDAGVGAALAGAVGLLPTLPAVCARLGAVLRDDDASLAAIGHVIETDAALASKLLQLTNSPFLGLRRRVSSVVEAVSYLGLSLVKSVLIAFAAIDALPVRARSFDPSAFQRRSTRVAHMARLLAPSPAQADDCFAAGLLHEIGKLLLASSLPERYETVARAAATSGTTFEAEEARAHAPTCPSHVSLGAYLLGAWGLPWPVVEGIANYPEAGTLEQTRLGVAGTIYLGRQLLAEAAHAEDAGTVDVAFARRVGVEGRLEEWRAKAAALVSA